MISLSDEMQLLVAGSMDYLDISSGNSFMKIIWSCLG